MTGRKTVTLKLDPQTWRDFRVALATNGWTAQDYLGGQVLRLIAETDVGMVCAYCGKRSPIDGPVPDLDDDDSWSHHAKYHKPDCDWILARAHKRDRPEEGGRS